MQTVLAAILLTTSLTFAEGPFHGNAKLLDVQLVPAGAVQRNEAANENYDFALEFESKIYTCRYIRHLLYRPSDLVVGTEVHFKVEGTHGVIQRGNGKDVKCTIIRVQLSPLAPQPGPK